MKKLFFIFSFIISFWSSAQDSTEIKKTILFDKINRSFNNNWRVEFIDPAIILKRDSLFLPSHFLFRVNLFMLESPEPAIAYFFDAQPKDSVLFHYFQNIFSKAFSDSSDSESIDEYESENMNNQYIAFSFCLSEKLCEQINAKFTNDMGLVMPKMEIKLVDIKQEEKYIEPPPPPPPMIKPPKTKLKKKD